MSGVRVAISLRWMRLLESELRRIIHSIDMDMHGEGINNARDIALALFMGIQPVLKHPENYRLLQNNEQ